MTLREFLKTVYANPDCDLDTKLVIVREENGKAIYDELFQIKVDDVEYIGPFGSYHDSKVIILGI